VRIRRDFAAPIDVLAGIPNNLWDHSAAHPFLSEDCPARCLGSIFVFPTAKGGIGSGSSASAGMLFPRLRSSVQSVFPGRMAWNWPHAAYSFFERRKIPGRNAGKDIEKQDGASL